MPLLEYVLNLLHCHDVSETFVIARNNADKIHVGEKEKKEGSESKRAIWAVKRSRSRSRSRSRLREREQSCCCFLPSPCSALKQKPRISSLSHQVMCHVLCFFDFVADCFRNISKTRALASMGCESRASIARAASTLVTPCATSKLAASSNQTLFS